jgi:glycosyltransferase involved in cell wall biosynthesis
MGLSVTFALPRVSVLMPAYNAERYIEQAIASALGQTIEGLEVIVVDDASSDATAAIVSRLAARDRRLQLVRLPVNRGPSAARNLALSRARGAWVALLDADNSFASHRLATLIALGEESQAEMVSDNVLLCAEDGSAPPEPLIPYAAWPEPRHLPAAEFIARNIAGRRNPRRSYGFMSPIFRRAFLDHHQLRYDERNRFGEDFMFYVSCLVRGARWWVSPEALYRYTIRSGSLTEVQSAADLLRIRTFESNLLDGDPIVRADPALARALRRHKSVIDRCYYYRAFTDAVKGGELGQARRLLFESTTGFRHIVQESVVQTPVIAAKAWRGGYRRKRSLRHVREVYR